jgi:hypothetical protein
LVPGKRRLLAVTFGLAAAAVFMSGDALDPDRPIARIGTHTIAYRDIGCNRKVLELNPQWRNGRTVEEACLAAEREEFRIRVSRALIEAACGIERCDLSESKVDPFRSPVLRDEQELRRFAAEARRIPEAVRRVYRGESVEAVYDDAVKPLKIPIERFRNEVEMYGSLERVERYLAKDFVSRMRSQYEERARGQAMRAALREKIAARARATNRSAEQAADDYLLFLRDAVGVTVLDDRFSIPQGREVFR